MKKIASQNLYGPKDFSVGLVQEIFITLGKKGFSPDMAKEIANVKSGKADEIVSLFGVESEVENWLQEILERERQYHLDFFGREFNLSKFKRTLKEYGQQKIQEWEKIGLEPHFFPKTSMTAGDDYLGWKVRPVRFFYRQVADGGIWRRINGKLRKVVTIELESITVLIDTRLKPDYKDGRQMYENDNLLGPIIEELRENGNLTKYALGPQSSRFNVCDSDGEWENQIKPALAKKLGLRKNQVRLERAIEANIIPQLYPYMPRKDDGKTDTSVVYEEYKEIRAPSRLKGGNSARGGLADISSSWFVMDGHSQSIRPLAVL